MYKWKVFLQVTKNVKVENNKRKSDLVQENIKNVTSRQPTLNTVGTHTHTKS